jgi:hypothetical protein
MYVVSSTFLPQNGWQPISLYIFPDFLVSLILFFLRYRPFWPCLSPVSLYSLSPFFIPYSPFVFHLLCHHTYLPQTIPLNGKLYHYTPQRAWGGRMYSSYSFLTSALDGDEWSASCPGRALGPGKGPQVPIVQEAGWAPEPVWTLRLEKKSFAPAGDRTSIARSSSPWSDTILTELPGS